MKQFTLQNQDGSYYVNRHIAVANINDAVIFQVEEKDIEEFTKSCAAIKCVPVEVK